MTAGTPAACIAKRALARPMLCLRADWVHLITP
jgi:hypothetical protein